MKKDQVNEASQHRTVKVTGFSRWFKTNCVDNQEQKRKINMDDFTSFVGHQVFKRRAGRRNPKPFKSGSILNTVMGVIDHPVMREPAFVFAEDDSFVLCRHCGTKSELELLLQTNSLSKQPAFNPDRAITVVPSPNKHHRLTVTPARILLKVLPDTSAEDRDIILKFTQHIASELGEVTQSWRGQIDIWRRSNGMRVASSEMLTNSEEQCQQFNQDLK